MADCIVSNWIAHYVICLRLHSDNAPEFRGHLITQLKYILVKGTFMAPYRPQSNWLCEHMNQTIENIIKYTVRENKENVGYITAVCNDGTYSKSSVIYRV